MIYTVPASMLGASWVYSNGSLTLDLPFSSSTSASVNTYFAGLYDTTGGSDVTPEYILYYI